MDISIPTNGAVEHIDVNDNTITWTTFEPLVAEQPKVAVGMLHLVHTSNISAISVAKVYTF